MKHWWEGYPWRMIQTNLRETDMENMNAAAYAKDLNDFGATVVTLNAAGIIASYHSSLPYHPDSEYLSGDSLKQMVDACHEEGIKVIARTDFSKIRESVYKEHPEWAYKTKDGEIVNYNGFVHTCPNSEYQRVHMFEILKELFSTHDFDGLFCNMSGFLVVDYSGKYHGPCHCENCSTRFKDEFGLELPEKDNFHSEVYKKYMLFKQNCEKQQNDKLYETVKSISPEIAINKWDYVRSESNTEMGRPQWEYSASSNSRVISGTERERPTDNASVDFMGFRYRQISVSPELMALRQWQNLANAGSLSLYIMGTLGNHRDTSSFAPTREVFQFHKKHESYYKDLKSAAKVLVMRKALWQTDPEVFGWIRALTESHIPFDELRLSEFEEISQLSGKEVLVLGDMKFISDRQAAIIDEFAEKGGIVIASGETGYFNEKYAPREQNALSCMGVGKKLDVKRNLMSSMFEITEEEAHHFPRCVNTPFIAPGDTVVFVDTDESVQKMLHLIPEHPFGPPEICYHSEVEETPGLLLHEYGEGKGIYVPWNIGTFYRNEGYANTLNLMKDLLYSIVGVEEIAEGLTPMVEINMVEKENQKMIQLINNSGCFSNSYFKPLPIYNIKLKINLKNHKDNNLVALRGGRVEGEYRDGYLYITLDELRDYEGIVITTN